MLFTGWFDNQAEIAARLGVPNNDAATVYGHAANRWGDATELHVVGEYCAVIDRPHRGQVRLARSPLSAPPLHYHRSRLGVAAASTPRALFALGLPQELDEGRLAMHLHAAAHDAEGGWYKGIEALQPGTVITATRSVAASPMIHGPFPSFACPATRTMSPPRRNCSAKASNGRSRDSANQPLC